MFISAVVPYEKQGSCCSAPKTIKKGTIKKPVALPPQQKQCMINVFLLSVVTVLL